MSIYEHLGAMGIHLAHWRAKELRIELSNHMILSPAGFESYLRAAAPAADPGNKTEELSFQPQGQQDGQDDRMLNLAPWDLSSPKKKSDLYAGKAAAKEILH